MYHKLTTFSANSCLYVYAVTVRGNNSYVSRNVSYNNTQLVLSCPGDANRTALWQRPDGSILCSSRRCAVNVERRLTNEDSGNYTCWSSVASGTEYQHIHINVLGEIFWIWKLQNAPA